MSTALGNHLTVAQFMALPEDGRRRHELLRGEHVITASPTLLHQTVVYELARILERLIGERDDVFVMNLDADLRLEEESILHPDLFLLVTAPGERFGDWSEVPVPVLTVEILSPSTKKRDRGIKREIYLEAAVSEYWIIDSRTRVLERWRPDGSTALVAGELVFDFGNGITGALSLPELFARVARKVRP